MAVFLFSILTDTFINKTSLKRTHQERGLFSILLKLNLNDVIYHTKQNRYTQFEKDFKILTAKSVNEFHTVIRERNMEINNNFLVTRKWKRKTSC